MGTVLQALENRSAKTANCSGATPCDDESALLWTLDPTMMHSDGAVTDMVADSAESASAASIASMLCEAASEAGTRDSDNASQQQPASRTPDSEASVANETSKGGIGELAAAMRMSLTAPTTAAAAADEYGAAKSTNPPQNHI